MIVQAIDLYNKVAFPGVPPIQSPPDLGSDYETSVAEHLDQFEFEKGKGEGIRLRRYVLRLGNSRYPFMKFVIQEHLIEDDFILLVDTHDDMFNMPSPDYDELKKIREYKPAGQDPDRGALDRGQNAHAGLAEGPVPQRQPDPPRGKRGHHHPRRG